MRSRRWFSGALLLAVVAVLLVPASGALAAVPGDPDYSSGAVFTRGEKSGCYANEITGMNVGDDTPVPLGFEIRLGGNIHDSVILSPNGVIAFETTSGKWSQPLTGQDELVWAEALIAGVSGFSSTLQYRENSHRFTTPTTWGTTTYNGRPALCVTWNHVHPWVAVPEYRNTPENPDVYHWGDYGYYDESRENHFQILVVGRSDVSDYAFDVVYNYDTVQWQDYRAFVNFDGVAALQRPQAGITGGVHGVDVCNYGYGCWVGYVTGRGSDGGYVGSIRGLGYPLTHYWFDQGDGSGFLDTSPTGLAVNATNSNVTGRHVLNVNEPEPEVVEFDPLADLSDAFDNVKWRSDTSWLDLNRYVALGDSYQSGEGASPFYLETNVPGINLCHRSSKAYPEILAKSALFEHSGTGDRPYLSFWACSGAVLKDIFNEDRSFHSNPWDDTRWFDHRHNNVIPGWRDSREHRRSQLERVTPDTAVVSLGIGGNDVGFSQIMVTCARTDDMIADLIAGIAGADALTIPRKSGATCEEATYGHFVDGLVRLVTPSADRPLQDWESLPGEIRTRAPGASLIVVGYPQLFPEQGEYFYGTLPFSDSCAGYLRSSQLYLNDLADDLNAASMKWAIKNGAVWVDPNQAMRGAELCGVSSPGINALVVSDIRQSFHPNGVGHQRIATAVTHTLLNADWDRPSKLALGETHSMQIEVPGGMDLYIANNFPGSDLPVTLIAPSGRTIDRNTIAGDISSEHGATFESFMVTDAEPGTWQVEVYGAEVNPAGEPYVLQYMLDDPDDTPPVPHIALAHSGPIVSVDASKSTDDREIVSYSWFFNDGANASGPTATHTYTEPGTYRVQLRVEDDRGKAAWSTHDVVVTVAENGDVSYGSFAGLTASDAAPNNGSPAAGAVPVSDTPSSLPLSSTATPTPSASPEDPAPSEQPTVVDPDTSDIDPTADADGGITGDESTGLVWWAWLVVALVAIGGAGAGWALLRRD